MTFQWPPWPPSKLHSPCPARVPIRLLRNKLISLHRVEGLGNTLNRYLLVGARVAFDALDFEEKWAAATRSWLVPFPKARTKHSADQEHPD